MSDIAPGQRIDDFEILEVAGRGGMGVVYRARQVSLDRIVAFKLIAAAITSDPDYLARFAREARVAAAVEHPHVVSVHGAGRHGDRPYIVMQWVDGDDLRTLIEDHGPLEPERACTIATQLASALDAIHERGLLHRDLKPANVLRHRVKGRDHVYLTDFGIAKFLLQQDSAPLTKTGYIVGTPGYIAPECIRGVEGDSRADVYALGCVMFECLAGERSFTASNEMALYWAHANDPRPKLSVFRPHLGERFDSVLERAMAIEPFDRFQNAKELADALQTALHSGVRPAPAASTVLSPPTTPAATPADTAPAAVALHTPTPTLPPTADPTPIHPGRPVASPARRSGPTTIAVGTLGAIALVGIVIASLLATGMLSRGEAPTTSSVSNATRSQTTGAAGREQPPPTEREPVPPAERKQEPAREPEPAPADVVTTPPAQAPSGERPTTTASPRAAAFTKGFITQLASFRQRVNAETEAGRLRSTGIDAEVLRSDDYVEFNPGFWVVYAGPFDTSASASDVARDSEIDGARGRLVTAAR